MVTKVCNDPSAGAAACTLIAVGLVAVSYNGLQDNFASSQGQQRESKPWQRCLNCLLPLLSQWNTVRDSGLYAVPSEPRSDFRKAALVGLTNCN